MKTQNNNQALLKILMATATMTLAACASNVTPLPETYNEPEAVTYAEPVGATNTESFEPAPMNNDSMMQSTTDLAMQEESSGITPPIEDYSLSGTPIEPMEPVADSMQEPAMMDAPADAMGESSAASSISAAPANHYTVQVVAASSMDKLTAFANTHNFSTDLTAQTTVNGRTWYVLLAGTYATLSEAKDALASIQYKVNTSPWIRRVGSLQ